MKLLLLHTKEEKEIFTLLESLLQKLNISFESMLLNSPQDIDINQFTALFDFSGFEENDEDNANAPTHVLTATPLHSQWFDFFAGFAFGSRIHILVYGREAISGISREFADFFTFIGNEASLQTYLEGEYEIFKKQDAARKIIKAQQSLLKMGIPVTVESLAQCVAENRVKEISLFLAAGFSVNSRNNAGVPILNVAARSGKCDVVHYLIAEGADVNLTAGDRGTTALIDSVMAQEPEIMEDLIEAGTDLDVKDKNGQTALIVAAGASRVKMVEALLKAGSGPDIPDSLGVSARKYASLFNNEAIMTLFNTIAPAKES